MPRGRKPRFWVKLDCFGVLHGSINWLLTLEGQAAWIKLIAYSEICGGPPGWVQDNEGKGLPHAFLTQELHVPLDVLEKMLKTMEKDKAISINGTGVIHLVNYESYQFTEYDRQKPYRQRKAQDNDPDKYIKGKYGHMVRRGLDKTEADRLERKKKGGELNDRPT